MICKKVVDIQEQLEIDINLVSVELDTYVKRLRYISAKQLNDAIQKDAFDYFWNYIQSNYPVVVSISDNLDVYEFGDDSFVIVLYKTLDDYYIMFDIQDAKKIENIIFSSDKRNSYK